jgi:lipid II:glycine glycyltransferase (peptidoglycan interpeptide bridge formation enzyme)
LEDLMEFYRLHLVTRVKHGVPVQPFRFFRNLWNTLRPKEMLTLFLVRHLDKVLAGMIVLFCKGVAYYKFGASDNRLHPLRGNQLLMWAAIRHAQMKRL